MRVLILAAILAYAAGAPSGAIFAPIAPAPIAIAGPIPTISPGDIQAAAINAKVAADDATQAAIDQARALNEQSLVDNTEKIIEANDQAKERSLEAFWSVEDQKWQAVDALKTAQAQLDGQIASNADAIAKSAIATPLIAFPAIPPAPVVDLSGFIPKSQTIVTQSLSQTHPVPLVKAQLAEPVVKTTESTATAEAEKATAEATEVKVAPIKAIALNENTFVSQSLTQTHPGLIGAPLAIAEPWLVPQLAFIQPELKHFTSSSITQRHGQLYIAPTLVGAW